VILDFERPMTIVKTFPADEPIVGMCQYKDIVVVATSKRVFRMKDGNAEQVLFQVLDEDCDMTEVFGG
jgi:hypothetical protein